MAGIRREYKDTLFRHLFGSEKRKSNALELYNALAGTGYDDPALIEITTIENVVFLGMKNDVSFLVGDEMVLWEHQSTHNPNMPLRGLHYFSRLYAKLVERRELDMYSSSALALPTPRYVVLYFGAEDRPDREVLRLSDSFRPGPGDVEVTATVLNCNAGRNEGIMDACETLRGYARLIALDRENRKAGMGLADAVRAAVSQCIEEGVLAGYLEQHRAEVEDMLFTMEDEERAMRVHREALAREAKAEGRAKGLAEGRAEGLAEGRAEGKAETVLSNLRSLMITTGCDVATAMDMLQIPELDRPALAEQLQ